jgi:alkaline phosphatase
MNRVLRFAFIVALTIVSATAGAAEKAKYVFLFIGDGMATTQRAATDYYLGAMQGIRIGEAPQKKLRMNTFPAQGLTSTYSIGDVITDSAAAATALACGYKTKSGFVSMSAGATHTFKTIAELAKDNGMRVGIVSSVSLDHATPACFYAHVRDRDSYYEISKQLVESDFDYFAGGQMKGNQPGARRRQPDLMPYARDKGWVIATNREELRRLKPGQKAIAYTVCDGDSAMNYALDRDPNEVTLTEFTRKGIELLDGEAGFFMMVEGGKIDWACHANDAATVIGDMIAFDEAVEEAVRFAEKHPGETLIVVTGDHECGGMTIGFAGTRYNSFPARISRQTMSFLEFNKQVASWRRSQTPFEEALPTIKEVYGFEKLSDYEMSQLQAAYSRSMQRSRQRVRNDETYLTYGDHEPLTVKCSHLTNRQAGLGWTSYSHTGVPVTTSARGVGEQFFNGYYDNTDIFHKIRILMQFEAVAPVAVSVDDEVVGDKSADDNSDGDEANSDS